MQRRRPAPKLRPIRRVEVRPGSQAQVDWVAPRVYVSELGGWTPLNAFNLSLSFSRMWSVQWRLDQAQLSWLDAHNGAFRAIGGVPWSVRFDNCKTAVASKGGPWAVLNPAYHSYAEQLGFAMEAADDIGAPLPDLEEAESRVRGMQSMLHQWAVAVSRHPSARIRGEPDAARVARPVRRADRRKPIRCETNRALWSDPTLLYPDAAGLSLSGGGHGLATRTVLSWPLSNTLDTAFCREALQEALAGYGRPEIFNTDHGSQFTSRNSPRFLSRPG